MLHVLSDAWICLRDERLVVTVLNFAKTLAAALHPLVVVGRYASDFVIHQCVQCRYSSFLKIWVQEVPNATPEQSREIS